MTSYELLRVDLSGTDICFRFVEFPLFSQSQRLLFFCSLFRTQLRYHPMLFLLHQIMFVQYHAVNKLTLRGIRMFPCDHVFVFLYDVCWKLWIWDKQTLLQFSGSLSVGKIWAANQRIYVFLSKTNKAANAWCISLNWTTPVPVHRIVLPIGSCVSVMECDLDCA
jgi:hypothetical protein